MQTSEPRKLANRPFVAFLLIIAIAVSAVSGAFLASWGQKNADAVQQDKAVAAAVIAQANFDQKQIYDEVIAAYNQSVRAPVNGNQSGEDCPTDCNLAIATVLSFTSLIHYGLGHGLDVNQTLIKQGYTPDCVQNCTSGINYFLDPTTVVTNQGRGLMQCLVYGSTSTDTCTAGNFAKFLGWSVSTATPAITDTYAGGAGQACSSTNIIADANGLAVSAGTVTPGANANPTVTTVAHTFAITGTYTAVQAACVISAVTGGTNPLLFAAATFGPDSFISGDSLTGTWTFSQS